MKRHDTRRRFEQWARNPECQANVVSAVHGIGMAKVVEAEGGEPTMGQSPFALGRGVTFEKRLFENGGATIGADLAEAGVLPSTDFEFHDFRLRKNGGTQQNLDSALSATRAYLKALAKSPPSRAALIVGATVVVPGGLMLPEALLVLDALVVTERDNQIVLTIGEIKTYPDRGGHTDAGELAVARAQAGVYLHGTRLVLDELDISDQCLVEDHGFLVLSKAGRNAPSVRGHEDLRYQAKRAERGFERLRHVAELVPNAADDDTKLLAVQGAPTAYRETCVAFCDRATLCHSKAVCAGDAAALGEDMVRLLGPVPLARAVEILNGDEAANDDDLPLRDQRVGSVG